MSPRPRKLPPPRGAEDTRTAMLTKRFDPPDEQEAAAAASTSTPVSDPAPAADTARTKTTGAKTAPTPATSTSSPARPTTRTPAGMTRRTYYVARDTAEALDAAVDQVVTATGGLITKHQALGAILAAGVDHVDQVAQDIRTQLLNNLGPPSTS